MSEPVIAPLVLRTSEGTEAVYFQDPTPENAGDITDTQPVTFMSEHHTHGKLGDILKTDPGKALWNKVLVNYGLTPEDGQKILAEKNPKERDLLYAVKGLSWRFEETRLESVKVLAANGSEIAIHALKGRAIFDPNEQVRIATVDALAKLDITKHFGLLKGVSVLDPSPAVKAKVKTVIDQAIADKKLTVGEWQATNVSGYRMKGLITPEQIAKENAKFLKIKYDFKSAMIEAAKQRVLR